MDSNVTAFLRVKTIYVAVRTLHQITAFYIGVSAAVRHYTVSQRNCANLFFCCLSVKYEPTAIKIGRVVPEETLNKIVPKMPISPKVCACTTLGNLKCQIEPSTQ